MRRMQLTVPEIARQLNVHRTTPNNWIKSGLIPESCLERIGGRVRIKAVEFEQLVREGKLNRSRCRPSGRGGAQ